MNLRVEDGPDVVPATSPLAVPLVPLVEVAAGATVTTGGAPGDRDRSIGTILAELRQLDAEQVERVLQYQRAQGKRFGEAAVALGLATTDDVLFALSQQFNYPYAPEARRGLSPDLVTLNEPFSPRAEHFRALRSQLMMRHFGEALGRQPLAVVSPEAGDGKSYCAANLAVVLAQVGGRTLLVDADMRHPRQRQVFGLPDAAGLSGLLAGRADRRVIQQVPGVASLFVLPVGPLPPNPAELVERPVFALLMQELASQFDHVVVDTPSGSAGADATVIAARCGAALLVARKDHSRLAALGELLDSLGGGGVRVAGVVVNEF